MCGGVELSVDNDLQPITGCTAASCFHRDVMDVRERGLLPQIRAQSLMR